MTAEQTKPRSLCASWKRETFLLLQRSPSSAVNPSELDEISACLRFPNLVKSNNSLQFSECMLDEVKSVGRRRGRLTDARRLVSHHLGRQRCSRTAGSDATRGLWACASTADETGQNALGRISFSSRSSKTASGVIIAVLTDQDERPPSTKIDIPEKASNFLNEKYANLVTLYFFIFTHATM